MVNWGKLGWLSGYGLLSGVLVLAVAIILQIVAPQGQTGEVKVSEGFGVRVGEQTPLNFLGMGLIALGIAGLIVTGMRARIAAWRTARVSRRARRRAEAIARRAQPLFAEGKSLEEVRVALLAEGLDEAELAAGLQQDWPRLDRCPRCGASVRQFTHAKAPRFHCPNCGWNGPPTALKG
jgi:hypothetical protein